MTQKNYHYFQKQVDVLLVVIFVLLDVDAKRVVNQSLVGQFLEIFFITQIQLRSFFYAMYCMY